MNPITQRFPAHMVKQLPGSGGRYIEHSHIRQRMLMLQNDGHLRFEWKVLELRDSQQGWIVHGRLEVGKPELQDGRTVWAWQTHEVISDYEQGPAAAESRAFARCAAFATGIGLQAWVGEDGYWLDKVKEDHEPEGTD